MFTRRTRAALFVDFDNVVALPKVGRRLVDQIDNWVMWLEDGGFEPKTKRPTKRRLVQKRVYWNTPNELHRPTFEAAGFDVFTCPSRVKDKQSAADMIIALDALQLAMSDPSVEEYMVLTTDTDFVPLLNKLEDLDKLSVAVGNPANVSFTVYADHADSVISVLELPNALSYTRPVGWFGRLAERFSRPAPAKPTPAPSASSASTSSTSTSSTSTSSTSTSSASTSAAAAAAAKTARPATTGGGLTRHASPLDEAAHHLVELGKRTPNLPIGQKTAMRVLKKQMPDFEGSNFLGCRSYQAMIEQIAPLREKLHVLRYGNKGKALVYRDG